MKASPQGGGQKDFSKTSNQNFLVKVEEKLKIEKTKKDTLYAQYKRAKDLQRINDSVKGARLDSLQGIYPKIKRDSIEQLLKVALHNKDTIHITKASKQ